MVKLHPFPSAPFFDFRKTHASRHADLLVKIFVLKEHEGSLIEQEEDECEEEINCNGLLFDPVGLE